MNEVNKHYGGSDRDGSGHTAGRTGSGSGGAGGRAEGAYDQASGWAKERYGEAASWASETYDSAARNVTYARRRSAVQLSRGYHSVEDFVQENPIMVGVAGLAIGMLIGTLIPATRRENQIFGSYADEVRDQGLRYAHDLAQQGRQIVEDSLGRGSSDRDTGDETTAAR